MKPVIGKELRENAVLAAIGFIVFSLMLLQSYHSASSVLADLVGQTYYGGYDDRVQPLVASEFLTKVSFFCAIFAAALGWKQIFTEHHRDLNAFFVHRPVKRSELFAGKVVAGLSLYAAASLVPLVFFILWVQYPGHLATPFEWRMAIPAFGFWTAGISFYFAGLLTGIRKVRWYGSRGLGLAAPVLVALAIGISSELWQVPVAAITGIILLGVAAWDAYRADGQFEPQSRPGKAAVALTLTLGSAVTLVFVGGLLMNLITQQDYPWSYYTIARDGTIYKVTQVRGKQPQITDLSGKLLLNEKTGRPLQMNEFNLRQAPSFSLNVDFESHPPGAFAENSRYFAIWGATPDTVWYFWNKYQRLIGYDLATRKYIGSIGPSGFVPNPSGEGTKFELPFNHNNWLRNNVLNTSTKAFVVDLDTRVPSCVFETTGENPIGGAASARADFEITERAPAYLIATRHFVHLVAPTLHTSWKLPYEPGYPNYTGIRLALLEKLKQHSLWFEPSFTQNMKVGFTLPTHCMWLTPDGQVNKSLELPPVRFPHPDHSGPIFISILASNLIVCLPLGIWICRRYAFAVGPTIGWATFMLVFGLPGLIAFLSVYEWPARETCPSCERMRVVTRDRCEHCSASFAVAREEGVEIFEQIAECNGKLPNS